MCSGPFRKKAQQLVVIAAVISDKMPKDVFSDKSNSCVCLR
jgi:hypothetical protein